MGFKRLGGGTVYSTKDHSTRRSIGFNGDSKSKVTAGMRVKLKSVNEITDIMDKRKDSLFSKVKAAVLGNTQLSELVQYAGQIARVASVDGEYFRPFYIDIPVTYPVPLSIVDVVAHDTNNYKNTEKPEGGNKVAYEKPDAGNFISTIAEVISDLDESERIAFKNELYNTVETFDDMEKLIKKYGEKSNDNPPDNTQPDTNV